MGFGAGQIVYEEDLDNLLPKYKFKNSITNRVNASLLDDPDLSAIALEPGNYEAELVAFYVITGTGVTANVPRIKTRWAFTGSWSGSLRSAMGPGIVSVSTDPSQVVTSTFRGVDATTQDSLYNAGVTTGYSTIVERGIITVTATGNLSFQWAQQTTTATATCAILPGSYFKISQLTT